jgi:integrase
MYPDGGGLYLRIAEDGGRAWVYRFMLNRRQREMGLGRLVDVTLAEARRKAQDARALKAQGIDPIEAKRARRAAERAEKARTVTFQDAAQAYIRSHKAGWRNAKHGDQWENTLKAYAYPHIGNLPVQEIDAGLVLKVLEPIWSAKTETASRVRGRIEAILDWATARGHRKGDNPARWRGHMENLLPKRAKVKRVQHHPALPYAEIGAFMADLRKQEGLAALALELLILTATRTSEAIAARWDEIDLKAKVWTIPADRIKAGREHRVPLSAQAVAILKSLQEAREKMPDGEPCPWVFPGVRGKSLSNGAILSLLRRMKRSDITAHGFRSTFRDWAAEQTAFPRDVAEMALAHAISDKVEAAYRRGDLYEKRKKLMEGWASYCGIVQVVGNKVVPFNNKAK